MLLIILSINTLPHSLRESFGELNRACDFDGILLELGRGCYQELAVCKPSFNAAVAAKHLLTLSAAFTTNESDTRSILCCALITLADNSSSTTTVISRVDLRTLSKRRACHETSRIFRTALSPTSSSIESCSVTYTRRATLRQACVDNQKRKWFLSFSVSK